MSTAMKQAPNLTLCLRLCRSDRQAIQQVVKANLLFLFFDKREKVPGLDFRVQFAIGFCHDLIQQIH